ncbi:MAG: CPBP family intramembrane metalloprotease [Brevundimonas sp.]|uniref:CPBP family intramembrane glutamic endopeptidase n=1 Tax=Brevundimonas sp. TaxID=1871086 RepID=UPI0025C2D6BC|nr:type II CAAX endopeptidase family protein [Brevundimonas sp.]MBX3478744.1 CPBP family intramembrane metalloprotease [Brevundimonas sp.]
MSGVELYAPRRARHRRTWTAAALALVLVFAIAGQALGVLPAVMAGFIDLKGGARDWPQVVYLLIVGFGAAALVTFAWVWLFERRGLREIGFNSRGAVRFLRGYGVGLAFLCVVVGIIAAIGGYTVEGPGALGTAAAGAALVPILALMAGFIIQGSTEEILFRGWLMQVIASRHGIWLALILNSVVFSLMHAGNIEPSRELWLGLANIVLFGVFISLYALREGSLWGVCGWHAAWNWLLGVGFGLEVSGQPLPTSPLVVDLATNAQTPWWLTGAAFGPEASVITTGVLVVGSAVLLLRGRTRDHGVVGLGVRG